MKKSIFTLVGICFLIFSCQNEILDVQEDSLLSASSSSSLQTSFVECVVQDLDRCDLPGFTSNFWWPEAETNWEQGLFSSDANNQLTFKENADGTAHIGGSTILGTCVVDVDVYLKDKKDWDAFTAAGGTFKDEANDCTNVDPSLLHYYVIDSIKSTITSSGDCYEETTFGVKQRPDPANATDGDPSTLHLGVIVGPGAGLFDASDPLAYGLSTWGWLTGGTKEYIMDFNFNFECTEIPCAECDGKINKLTLEYNGDAAAEIIVKTKKEGETSGMKVVFQENVAPGETFEFVGNDKKGTLGTQITIYVDGVKNTQIHTSCSDERVAPGFVSGDFTVVSGTSRKGGDLCPVDTPPGDDDDDDDNGDDDDDNGHDDDDDDDNGHDDDDDDDNGHDDDDDDDNGHDDDDDDDDNGHDDDDDDDNGHDDDDDDDNGHDDDDDDDNGHDDDDDDDNGHDDDDDDDNGHDDDDDDDNGHDDDDDDDNGHDDDDDNGDGHDDDDDDDNGHDDDDDDDDNGHDTVG